MNQRTEIIEKLRVQFATAVGLAAVYFFLWQALVGRDPLWPITFIAEGNPANLAVFTLILLGLAIFASLLTLGLRPSGPLLAALIGTGALSLRCPQSRTLLWAHQDNLARLFAGMIVEILLLAVAVALAGLVISSIRYAAGQINPKWRWPGEEVEPVKRSGWAEELFAPEVQSVISLLGGGKNNISRRQAASGMLAKSLYCLLTGLAIANVALLVIMQSPLRGQIIFALMLSFFVAALAAYKTFSVSSCVPAVAMALISAVGLYTLAAFMSISGTGSAWMSVPNFARALPIDYLTAGGGGAVLGYWVNCRINQAKVAELRKQKLQEL